MTTNRKIIDYCLVTFNEQKYGDSDYSNIISKLKEGFELYGSPILVEDVYLTGRGEYKFYRQAMVKYKTFLM